MEVESYRVGPIREWCRITRREDTKWWQILVGIHKQDTEEFGRLRPAFGSVGLDLLKTNGD